ncbi:MAG: hypothetical protein EOO17_00805 [Chloroflexi bacterium]|nr:MAG: hypothetical protein EOO17_00805 [Chloroflexota bacterium]
MLQEFHTIIKPLNNDLAKMLNMQDDYTVIPVKVTFKSGTTQVIEDGLVSECDHKGADLGDVELSSLHYNPITESVEEYDVTRRGLVCDQCPAWQDESGEWYE